MTTSNLDLLELRKRRDLLRREAELRERFGLLFYQPHPKQEAFHAAANFKFRLLEAGNRFGKSDCGAAEVCAYALGERPWLPKDDPNRYLGIQQKSNKILVICADWDKVDEIFSGDGSRGDRAKLWKFLPKDKAQPTGRSSTGSINKIVVESRWGGTSSIYFDTRKSFAINPMGSESSNWDFILIDEPITKPHWTAVSRGLIDNDGAAAFTCTNLDQPWISDFFQVKPNRKEEKHTVYIRGRASRWIMRGSMYDNPHLTPAAIKEFESQITEEERACRILGRPLHLSGIVYKEFDEEKHLLKDLPPGWSAWDNPPADYTTYVAVDTHPRTPHATLYACVDPNNNIYFYKERFEAETLNELAAPLLNHSYGRNMMSYQLEPGAWIPDPTTKISFANGLHEKGLPFTKAIKDLKGGILNARQYLKLGKVFFVPTLERTLWEIEHYCWQIEHGQPTNKPIDKDDHMLECFYRILLTHPVYEPPSDNNRLAVEPTEITTRLAFENIESTVEDTSDDWSYALNS